MKKINKTKWIIITEIILILIICFLNALKAGHYVNFNPINGTFQNFNPIRRLLDGQVPYRDFVDYLGMGHLYVGSFITFIFGGDYQASLVGFTFLTNMNLVLISYIIGNVIIKKIETILAIINLILIILLVQPIDFLYTSSITYDLMNSFNSALSVGNSARFVRGLILPIIISLFYIGYNLYEKNKFKIEKSKKSRWIILSFIGFLGGISFIWSNDYGIATSICLLVLTFWVSFSKTKKILRSLTNVLFELIVAFITIFILIEILTLGNFPNWISYIFGTGGYQSWYYNSIKSYYLFDVDFSFLMLIQATLVIRYLYLIFKNKANKSLKYIILSFINMTSFCVVNEYKLLSGNDCKEVALTILTMTIIYEAINLIKENKKIEKNLIIVSLIISISWIGSAIKEESVFRILDEKDNYIEELGGNMTNLYSDIKEATVFLNNNKFFSTYASAQEVVEKTYQPSGVDYIIHILGDEQRKEYINSFNKSDFEYAVTINPNYTVWEYWVERANWFFYRELYNNYHPVFSNSYETYWEKNKTNYSFNKDINIEVTYINESTRKIIVKTDKNIDGIADVKINYEVNKKDNLSSKYLFRKALKVENTGNNYVEELYYESNYLRDKSEEYIPVTIVNGYGEVTLTSSPKESTKLKINFVECDKLYTVTFDYLQFNKIKNYDNVTSFTILKTEKNIEILDDAKEITLEDKVYKINTIEENENNIIISVNSRINLNTTSNMILIK